MKFSRWVTPLILASFTAATAWSQVVDFVSVSFRQQMVQTGTATVGLSSGTPFTFRAGVDGNNLGQTSPISAATITPPSGSPLSLTASLFGGNYEWEYVSGGYSTLNDLLVAFPANGGSYTLALTGTPNGNTGIVVPGFSSTVLQAPVLTLSGGTWNGGVYQLTPGSGLGVEFNSPFSSSPGGTDAFHYYVDANGNFNGSITTPEGFLNYNSETSSSVSGSISTFNIGASSFNAGQSYTFLVSYEQILSWDATAYGNAVTAVGLFEIRTSFTVQAIPEPSTYAALFGAVGLLGVVAQRRRRVV
ncbi:MAG: hypothetical protein C0518_07840 [Opitutus sp.]|nr:hypothetical protein [Opitutus sp.]